MDTIELVKRIEAGESSRLLDAEIECALSDEDIVPDGTDGRVMGDGFLCYGSRPYTTCGDEFRRHAIQRLAEERLQ